MSNKGRPGFKFPPGTHWMQKPENRERVQELARRRARKRHRKAVRKAKVAKLEETKQFLFGNEPAVATDTQVAYLFGRITGWVDSFAEQNKLSALQVRTEIGRMLVNGKDGAV